MKNFTKTFEVNIKIYFILLLLTITLPLFSQNVGINTTGAPPNSSAGLDVDFPDKGLLIPRVNLTSTTSFAPLSAHVAGMVVYNLATVGDVKPGFYYNNGTKWIPGFLTGNNLGDMLYWNGTDWQMISIGSPGQFLQISSSNIPTWGGASFSTISTIAASSITGITAVSGGNITSDGGNAVLSRGVCWSTSPGPTIANTKTTDGAGIGVFASNLTGLTPVTSYYVRAYAINSNVISYGNEISFTTTAVLPTLAATFAATGITGTSASSGGNVTSDGGSPILERGICYGTTANPTILNTKVIDPLPGVGSFGSNLTGLTGYTTYYVRAYATNSIGTAYGTQISFTTLRIPPTIETVPASSISGASATSGGSMTWNGGGYSNYQAYGVAYSTTPNSPTPTKVATNTSNFPYTTPILPWTTNLTGLSANTTYYIRAYLDVYPTGTGPWTTVYGNELSFTTTAPTAPVITSTTAVTVLSANTAKSGGTITSDGGAAITAKGVCWGTTTNPTLGVGNFTTDGTGTATYISNISGLTGSTTYYVRAYATNSVGTTYGPTSLSFTTWVQAPYALGQDVGYGICAYVSPLGNGFIVSYDIPFTGSWGCSGTTIGTSTALGSGLANTNLILANCPTRPIAASVAKDYNGGGFTDWYLPSSGEWAQILTGAASNLYYHSTNNFYTSSEYSSPSTYASSVFFNYNSGYSSGASKAGGSGQYIYYLRAIRNFSAAAAPTVTTTSMSNVSSTTATSGGDVTNDGGATITARGVCWSTSPSPTITNSLTVDGTGAGIFTSSLTGLSLSTTYYVRAYATNIAGTSYGNEVSFTTTGASSPVVTTDPISNPAPTSATSGGNVTSDGGSAVTAYGVCWSTTTAPTILDTKTTDGSGTGTYISSITGLTTNTTYYIRAYATNAIGTSYGNEIIYTPVLAGLPTINTDSIINMFGAMAEGGGTLVSDGGNAISEQGLVWSTSPNPTILSNLGLVTDPTFGTTYFSLLSGLTIGTTYHVRAYATNIIGTSYGNDITFIATAATIGQFISGGNITGNIFYIDGTGLHGLIADPWGFGTSDWGCTNTTTGASGTTIGTGFSNTTAILNDITTNACVSPSPSAAYAAEISKWLGPDWYLPSKDEFDMLWTNRVASGLDANISGAFPFWSSSEVDATTVWYFDGTTWVNTGLKTDFYTVWPIRSF